MSMRKNKDVTEKKEIVKSNSLIEGSYKLTISENRIIDIALTKVEVIMLDKDLTAEDVKYQIEHNSFECLYVYASEYKKEYNLTTCQMYKDLAETANRLYNRSIIYYDETEKELITKRWVITCKYNDAKKAIAIQFHPDLVPDLLVFKNRYTIFNFDVTKRVKNYYACRIYELLKQYESIKMREFDIEDLRFKLGIEDNEYSRYSTLKQQVIKPSIEKINKLTDIYIELEEKVYNRKVEKIKFRIEPQKMDFVQNQIVFPNIENVPNQNYNAVKDFRELLGFTITPRQIDKLINITSISIKEFNSNLSIREYIKEKKIVVDNYAKRNKITTPFGILLKAVQNNWTINSWSKTSNFNSFDQRKYEEMDDLEWKLLGYENLYGDREEFLKNNFIEKSC